MFFKRQNILQIFYLQEIVISVYLLMTGLLIMLSHSQLSNIQLHIFPRILLFILFIFLSLIKKKNWTAVEIIRVFIPFPIMAFLYSETDYLNNLLFRNNLDYYFSKIEEILFTGQPSLTFAVSVSSNLFAESMYFGYFTYYLLIFGIPAYFYFWLDKEFSIKIIFSIICSFLIYYTIFIVIPVAGPQFYFSNTMEPLPEGYIFGSAMRLIQNFGEAPTAAFPSSHVSICLLINWICFKHKKNLLFIVVPVSLLLLLSTVYLRAHYIIDVIAGIIFTPVVYYISNIIWVKLSKIYLIEKK